MNMEEQIIDAVRGELKRQAEAGERGLKVSDEEPGILAVAVFNRARDDASAMPPWDGVATWWLETRWATDDPGEVRRRIEAGPVRSHS